MHYSIFNKLTVLGTKNQLDQVTHLLNGDDSLHNPKPVLSNVIPVPEAFYANEYSIEKRLKWWDKNWGCECTTPGIYTEKNSFDFFSINGHAYKLVEVLSKKFSEIGFILLCEEKPENDSPLLKALYKNGTIIEYLPLNNEIDKFWEPVLD